MEIQIIYWDDTTRETEIARSFEEAEEKLAILKSIYQPTEPDPDEAEKIMNESLSAL